MTGAQAADHPETPSFGEWVRAQRKSLWLTQKKLARLVGCAPVTIQKIEEGYRRPSPPVAGALAQHLEIAEEELQQFLHSARTTPITARTPVIKGPSSTFNSVQDGLPVPPQSLIGRDETLLSLQQSLLLPSLRLITLTGPPGVGKTRLAVQVASELRREFGGRLSFVPLAPLDEHEQVLPTINRRLGLADSGAATPAELLIRFLRGRHLLLVLDNFEHLLGAAPLLGNVLEACPGLRVLVTSRTALRLSGEQEWPLEPLAHGPATQLFAERVRAFDPSFVLNAQILPYVTEIVHRLDGLPLAIELAAVRLRYGSPEILATRLRTELLGSLGSGPVDGPVHQHTLQSAIAWSYERLDPRLQQVFRQLGVFVGGWDAEAAETVAGADSIDLESLLDGHLIRQGGQMRFAFLETLRAFALERLIEHHEAAAVGDAHQLHFLTAALAHQHTELDWFEAEVGNLRAALRTQLDSGQAEAALKLALGIHWFWETRGYQREGLEWFRVILAQSAQVIPSLRLSGLNTGSTMAWQTGHFDLSRTWLTEALALSRLIGDMQWEASLLMHQGKVELEQGCYEQAQHVLARALKIARELALPLLVCPILLQMADGRLSEGKLEDAQELADGGLALCQDYPGLLWEAPLLQVIALVALERGQAPLARRHLIQALRLAFGIEHRMQLTLFLTDFAATLTAPDASRADLRRAATLWSCAEATRNYSGYGWSVAFVKRFEWWTSQAQQRLSKADWTLAWEAGQTLHLQQAVVELLAESADTPGTSYDGNPGVGCA